MSVPRTLDHEICSLIHHVRIIRGIHPRPVKQEAAALEGFALALAESIHELLKLRGALDLEENFVVIVGDFDIQVFGLRLLFLSLAAW